MHRRPNSSLHAAMLAAVVCGGCTTVVSTTPPQLTGGVTFIRPRCADVESCLLGQVVAAESAQPLSQAAVFLEREDQLDDEPTRFLTLTDDQGVFTVADAPAGRYRIAVYKDARRMEARGLELGARGTTVVPVRLPPS
jgi:hypothetical protein